jgi:hypothetical protein
MPRHGGLLGADPMWGYSVPDVGGREKILSCMDETGKDCYKGFFNSILSCFDYYFQESYWGFILTSIYHIQITDVWQ